MVYDEIRQPHCTAAQEYANGHEVMIKAPVGPLQQMRDDALGRTLVFKEGQYMDEEEFRAAWGNDLVLFAHDATDKVKDWWRQWGYMIGRGRSPNVPAADILVYISMGKTVWI